MPYMVIKKFVYVSIKKNRWLDENLNLNAFHNNNKKIEVDHSVKYRQTTAINKER